MKILTALDRSEYSEIVLEHGLDQAAQHPGAELHFATIVPDDDDAAACRAWLDRFVREGLDAFRIADRHIVLHILRGTAASEIASLASDLPAGLLVIGRFHVPSESDVIIDMVECPTLVVGIEGHILEPQCPACRAVRRDTSGEQLFCEAHMSDRLPDFATRVSAPLFIHSRVW